MIKNKHMDFSKKLRTVESFLTTKYFEVEDFVHCILISLLSQTNMIALGQPGIAKSAVLREIVTLIDFENYPGTPYFHIQMGADISPNNVFGAPDINHFKSHGIIKRHYEGFLPDAIIAFCSEFYRVSDQVANSGLLTLLNEGEFKNGTDTVKSKLRFFMADTNFFPKQADDLDAEDSDLRLQALHDRFLARAYVKPLSDDTNKINMILMDDKVKPDLSISISDIIYAQDHLNEIELSEDIAADMVYVATRLETEHDIFISPRRLKLSRNLVRANAFLAGRSVCLPEDILALQYTFWQKIEDIITVKTVIYDRLDTPRKDAKNYEKMLQSIINELERHINNRKDLPDFDADALYAQSLADVMRLLEQIHGTYPQRGFHDEIDDIYNKVQSTHKHLISQRHALENTNKGS